MKVRAMAMETGAGPLERARAVAVPAARPVVAVAAPALGHAAHARRNETMKKMQASAGIAANLVSLRKSAQTDGSVGDVESNVYA